MVCWAVPSKPLIWLLGDGLARRSRQAFSHSLKFALTEIQSIVTDHIRRYDKSISFKKSLVLPVRLVPNENPLSKQLAG